MTTEATAATYKILLLGDTHYDDATARGDVTLTQAELGTFQRNVTAWATGVPPMLAAAGKLAAEATCVVQLGDFIHGACASAELHNKALATGLAHLKQPFAIPFYVIKGNHDIVAPAGEDNFAEVIGTYQKATLGERAFLSDGLNYALRQGPDLFIYFDSVTPRVDFIAQAVAAAPDKRHLFLLSHLPVIPSALGQAAWVICGIKDNADAARARLLDLLARHNAIVLACHTHHTMLSHYRSEVGKITQFTCFSMPHQTTPLFRETNHEGTDYFTWDNVVKGMQEAAVKRVLADFMGKLTAFTHYGTCAGFNILRVTDEGVFIDIHPGAAEIPAKTIAVKTT